VDQTLKFAVKLDCVSVTLDCVLFCCETLLW